MRYGPVVHIDRCRLPAEMATSGAFVGIARQLAKCARFNHLAAPKTCRQSGMPLSWRRQMSAAVCPGKARRASVAAGPKRRGPKIDECGELVY